MNKILIIQFSDLHIDKDSNIWDQTKAELIAQSAARNRPFKDILLIFSGDIANKGAAEDYSIAEDFITWIALKLDDITGITPKIIVAPGNHDCDFSKQSEFRDISLGKKVPDSFKIKERFEKLIEPLGNYFSFESKIENFKYSKKNSVEKSGVLSVDKFSLQFRVFNTPIFSQIKEKKGDLYLPPSIFSEGWEDASVRIAVLHHPTPWLDQGIARDIRTSLRTNATITLYGHEHIPEVTNLDAYNCNSSSGSIEIDGPVLNGHHGSDECAFIALEIDVDSSTLQAFVHTYNSTLNHFEENSLINYNQQLACIGLPEKRRFLINKNFLSKISDPGVPALKPDGKSLTLKDIYVAPDLMGHTSKSGVDEIIDVSQIYGSTRFHEGLVIQGDEKFGKTSLLFNLFEIYYDLGYIPLYVSLRDHQIKKADDFIKIFKNSIQSIYLDESYDSYVALSPTRKVLLIDDVDAIKSPELRHELIAYLKNQSSIFFITSTMKTRMTEVLTEDNEGTLSSLPQLSIDRFGAAKRSSLIHKWVRATHDDLSTEEFLKKIDTLEKAATGILGHNMVPRVPHMLLIFLQSSNSIGNSKLESGALSNYYTFLVTEHLLKSGVNKEELEEYLSFSRLISYNMHKSGKTYITSDEFEECNKIFSEAYYPGSSNSRRNVLVNAKLLQQHGSDAYEWRHGYFHYLFLGEYLGKNIDEIEVRDIVKDMCNHLYVRSNANALLFLVHFSKDPFIFDCIGNVINNLFIDEKRLNLGVDTIKFSDFIKDAKNIRWPENDPIENRKRIHIAKDNHERKNGDGLLDARRNDKLPILEQLIVLFKTAEIIGQVLKEQYASIKRSVREPVVVSLLESYLRACGGLIHKLAGNKEIIKKWVQGDNSVQLKPTEAALRAEELTAEVVQIFMFAFFQKLGESIASEKTLDLVKGIDWKNKIEADVFLLTCELNLQRSIPLGKIDEILNIAKDDPAFIALIRNLVQMHLGLFSTKTQELQALSSRFNIPLDRLKKLTYIDSTKR